MNKEEKKLYKKIEDIYNSISNIDSIFSKDESIILERWIVIGILNKHAFEDTTGWSDSHKTFIQNRNYPFTPLGEAEYKKDWYLKFRNSRVIIIIRDILTVTAFLISLYIAIINVIEK